LVGIYRRLHERGRLAHGRCEAGGSAGGQNRFGFFGGVAFATSPGCNAFGESLADVVAVLEEPVAFGIEQVEGVVEEVVGGGGGAAGELALDALFGRWGRALASWQVMERSGPK
jgi:hypothetical protein